MSCLLLMVHDLCFNTAIFFTGNVSRAGSKNTRHPFLFHLDKMYISTYQMPVVPGHILRLLLWEGRSAEWHLVCVSIQYSYSTPHYRFLCFLFLSSLLFESLSLVTPYKHSTNGLILLSPS